MQASDRRWRTRPRLIAMAPFADTVTSERADSAPARHRSFDPGRLLAAAATTWFVTALIGQLVFSIYITIVYGGATLNGDPSRWNRIMPNGHIPGDRIGNTAIALHVLLAVLIMAGGAAQLVPAVRRRAPALHRRCTAGLAVRTWSPSRSAASPGCIWSGCAGASVICRNTLQFRSTP